MSDEEPAAPRSPEPPRSGAIAGTAASGMSLEEVERTMIQQSLAANNGRRKAAADQLGISERTLYRKIKEYGLE